MATEKHQISRRAIDGKDILLILLALIAAASLAVAVRTVRTRNRPEPSGEAVITEAPQKLTDSIDVPGYGALCFRAETTEQDVTIPNPPQNFCWFEVSLLLEDGTVLWTSRLIPPGEESEAITLSAPLKQGEYPNARLQYHCYSDETAQNALNGAETRLTIIVK